MVIRVPEAELSRIKREVSVERLVEASGVTLHKRGSDLVGLCPFHEDKDPSLVVTPSKNLWRCFSCDVGSVIDWVMRAQGVSFRHAVELLRSDDPLIGTPATGTSRSTKAKLPPLFSGEETDEELLEGVARYYRETLLRSADGLSYLEQRGLRDEALIERFELGFSDRTLGYRLPAKTRKVGKDLRARLTELGVLRDSGHEHLRSCVVVPLRDRAGKLVQLYGRRTGQRAPRDGVLHLYLPRPLGGVFNAAGIEGAEEVVLCESLLDALTFHAAGIPNVTTTLGTNGAVKEVMAAIAASGAKRFFIAYDRDDAGDKAATKLAENGPLLAGLEVRRVLFPRGMDANEYALKVTPARKSLELVLRKAEWVRTWPSADDPQPAAEEGQPSVAEPTDNTEPLPLAAEPPDEEPAGDAAVDVDVDVDEREVRMRIGDRRWRVRGLQKNTSFDVLKVNVLCARDDAFHVDTLDLYSARHRAAFLKEAASELSLKESALRRDLGRVLLKLEDLQEQALSSLLEEREEAPSMTPQERDDALALLEDPRLTERILEDFDAIGVVGEQTNKLTGYLAAVSRKLDKPLAVIVQSSSAAGKSSLMDAVLAFVPDEDKTKYSAMTGQSLFYMSEEDLSHKVLAIVEEEGAERAAYALKLLQSEGELSIASTGKDPDTGRHVTHEYRVEGPVMIFLTTTAIEIDEELLNRCLVLTVDEEREQTRAIHALQRRAQTLAGLLKTQDKARVLQRHNNAQRLLEPLLVANPYAEQLTFTDAVTRTRRDHMKYLTLIRTIALLHQHQRETKRVHHDGQDLAYIEVEPADIELANRLCHEVLGRSLDELPPQSRRLLALLSEMVKAACEELALERSEYRFTRKDVRRFTGWSEIQVRTHIDKLAELEHVLVHRGGRGQRYEYELLTEVRDDDGAPRLNGLKDAETFAYGANFEGCSSPVRAPFEGASRGAEIVKKLNGDEPLPKTSSAGAENTSPAARDDVRRTRSLIEVAGR